MNKAQKVRELCQQTVENMGYELYDVTYKKESDGMNLTLLIDCPNGIVIDDCERVSLAIEPIIDDANVIEDGYNLNVASIGLDHPVKDERDFIRNRDKEIEITLYAQIGEGKNKRKHLVGKLVSWTENDVTIIEDDKTLTLERKSIASIIPHIKF
ncbi:MAG: ribosome maturation factor RimP [Firmicutes bacterium]|nr:ribosome maturation factor RimP [Bacillota bacterium]